MKQVVVIFTTEELKDAWDMAEIVKKFSPNTKEGKDQIVKCNAILEALRNAQPFFNKE